MKRLGLSLLALGTAFNAFAVVFVDGGNSGSADGASWSTAFRTVQEGIDVAAAAGDSEVWVAAGTYVTSATDLREETILLKSNVAVYGGFSGHEALRSERDWKAHATLLSGNIGQENLATDNAYHVVSCTNAANAVLDGFTIQEGYATGPNLGGGGNADMNSTSAEAIISGINHSAGGGILNYQAAGTFRNCVVSNNYAKKAGGAYNMVSTTAKGSDSEPNPRYENCTFVDNVAEKRGGGVQNDVATHPVFSNCRFLDNRCEVKGGGLYNDFYCSPTLTNCVFAGNYAIMAGAMGNDGSSSPTLVNCVFALNEAWDKGAALYNGSHSATAAANQPTVINCIFFGNTITTAPGPADLELWHDNFVEMSYSLIEEPYDGLGNLFEDPRFADAAQYDFRLVNSSPAVDAGISVAGRTADLAGTPVALDGNLDGVAAADMGAFETVNPAADSDADGMLDQWELDYGFQPTAAEDGSADLDGDGMSRAQESIANTDPADPDSVFAISAIQAADAALRVEVPVAENRLYTLYYSTNLTAASWRPSTIYQSDATGFLEFLPAPEHEHLFYRVEVQVP